MELSGKLCKYNFQMIHLILLELVLKSRKWSGLNLDLHGSAKFVVDKSEVHVFNIL